jgi:hypothetical protein
MLVEPPDIIGFMKDVDSGDDYFGGQYFSFS